jgi:hypothetical protein
MVSFFLSYILPRQLGEQLAKRIQGHSRRRIKGVMLLGVWAARKNIYSIRNNDKTFGQFGPLRKFMVIPAQWGVQEVRE